MSQNLPRYVLIITDENQGKVSESEVVDNYQISHGEHADLNPKPTINTGDHIDNLTKENVPTEDTTLHDQKNDGNVESLLVGDSNTHGDGSDKREIDDNLESLRKPKSDKQNFHKESLAFSKSDSRHSVGFEKSVKTDDNILLRHVDIDKEHRISDDDSTKEYLESDPNKSGKILSDTENNNMHHLKDILKSSLPDGNDIHQYIIEHSVAETSEILGEMYPDRNEDVVKDTETQNSGKEPEKPLNDEEVHSDTLPITRENNEKNVNSETKLDNDRAVDYTPEIKKSVETSSQDTDDGVKEADPKSFKVSENADKVSFDTKEKQKEDEISEAKRGKELVVEESTSDRHFAKDADEEKTDVLTKHANKPDYSVEGTREVDGSVIVNTDTGNVNEKESNSFDRDNKQTGVKGDNNEEIDIEFTNKVDGNQQNNVQTENETLLQHIDNEDVGDDFFKDDKKMLHNDQMFAEKQRELKVVEKQGNEADEVTLEEAAPGQQILDTQDNDPGKIIDYQGKDEEDLMTIEELKHALKDEAIEKTDGGLFHTVWLDCCALCVHPNTVSTYSCAGSCFLAHTFIHCD